MFYRINGSIGVLKDERLFCEKIAEHMTHEKGVEVIPLGETKEQLFDNILDKTFQAEALIQAIRDMAHLHEQGTLVDYSCNPYIYLCDMVKDISEEIKDLASATDPEYSDQELKPLSEYGKGKAGQEESLIAEMMDTAGKKHKIEGVVEPLIRLHERLQRKNNLNPPERRELSKDLKRSIDEILLGIGVAPIALKACYKQYLYHIEHEK